MERGDPILYYTMIPNNTKQLYFGRVNFKFTWVVTNPLRKTSYKKKKKRKKKEKAQEDEG